MAHSNGDREFDKKVSERARIEGDLEVAAPALGLLAAAQHHDGRSGS
jgi:hypothetical protein